MTASLSRDEIYHAARKRFAPIVVSQATFAMWLGDQEEMTKHAEDGYLACALRDGDAAAHRYFDQHHVPELRRRLLRAGRSRAAVDETLQQLRCHLFVGPPPRIGSYVGRGPLLGWLHVVATRLALDAVRAERGKHRSLAEAHVVEAAPRLAAFRDVRARELSIAVTEALSSLDPAELELLGYYYVQGLSTAMIGALLGTHKATVARRLEKQREALYQAVRDRLRATVSTSTELDSLFRSIFSRLAISLPRVES